MQAMRWALGGMAGAAIGAGVWGAIAFFTGYEIGWLAVGVGFLCGLGARLAGGGEPNAGAGAVAIGCAVLGLLAGKFLTASLVMRGDEVSAEIEQVLVDFNNDEFVVSFIADDLVVEYADAGMALSYPAGADYENPASEADYPVDVWRDAMSRWNAMTPADQEAYREAQREVFRQQMHAGARAASGELMLENISPFDALWVLLAVAAAWSAAAKVGE